MNIYGYSCSGTPSPNTMTAAQVTSDWNESTITWNNKPSSTNSVSGDASCTRPFYYFDIKNIVENWHSGQPNYGLKVYGPKNGTWERKAYNDQNQIYITVGYTLPDTAPPAAPPSNPPATPPADNGSTESANSTGGSGENSTASTPVASTSKPASQAIAPVDKSIKAPVLTSVKKNGKEIKFDKLVEINEKDSLEIFGTSFAGAKIVIFISNIAFETTASPDGKWRIVTDNKKVKTGEQNVQAQAQKDGKGSEKVTLFKLKKTETKSVQLKDERNSKYKILFFVLGTFILIFLVGVLINFRHHFILKLRKKLKKK